MTTFIFVSFSTHFLTFISVIFIDFNYDGKVGEKSQRSLDQVAYEDGSTRARSAYKDSYGNPVSYDNLDDVDSQRPSSNKDKPLMYVIPGYASGILDPSEPLSRSNNFDNQEARKINDDRIHFVDPQSNVFTQNFFNTQKPINIPRPNLDLSETPVNPINDPLSPENIHLPPNALSSGGFASVSNPPNVESSTFPPIDPKDDPLSPHNIHLPPNALASGGFAALSFESPYDQTGYASELSQGLTPPVLPTNIGFNFNQPKAASVGTFALDQGLLPPPESSTFNQPKINNQPSTFNNNQDGPVIITDEQTIFAPKPSNGLQPPIDNSFNFQSRPTESSVGTPSSSTKFTGTFSGSLDGGITNTYAPTTQQSFRDIPVVVLQTPSKVSGNKYQGSFGGAPGVLNADTQFNRATPTQGSFLPQFTPSTSSTNAIDRPNRFNTNFGGAPGILGGSTVSRNPIPSASTSQSTFTQPPSSIVSSTIIERAKDKYQGQFGGAPGVLQPFDKN